MGSGKTSQPKPPAEKKELHFFPGEHKIIWVVNGKPAIKAEAWGGEEPAPGVKYDVMKPRPTTPGHYVIQSYAPYTTNTWALSKIAWGTKLSLDVSGTTLMYETGLAKPAWKRVEDKIPGVTVDWIKGQYFRLYGNTGKYDVDRDGIPDIWVFNDFGAWAVRYFQDKNRNKKLDSDESLSGEMLHTTPENEAEVATGKPVALGASHGCIHLNPTQREMLHNAGAFEKGTDLIIHGYKEPIPTSLK